jgi:hypothetical protein
MQRRRLLRPRCKPSPQTKNPPAGRGLCCWAGPLATAAPLLHRALPPLPPPSPLLAGAVAACGMAAPPRRRRLAPPYPRGRSPGRCGELQEARAPAAGARPSTRPSTCGPCARRPPSWPACACSRQAPPASACRGGGCPAAVGAARGRRGARGEGTGAGQAAERRGCRRRAPRPWRAPLETRRSTCAAAAAGCHTGSAALHWRAQLPIQRPANCRSRCARGARAALLLRRRYDAARRGGRRRASRRLSRAAAAAARRAASAAPPPPPPPPPPGQLHRHPTCAPAAAARPCGAPLRRGGGRRRARPPPPDARTFFLATLSARLSLPTLSSSITRFS